MNYNYDGQLAAYFLLAFLVLLLVPLSLSFTSQLRSKPVETACECSECSAHREQLRKSGNSLFAGLSTKAIITISGWVLFTAVLYVVITSPSPTSTVYDPFTILGISESANEKEIKKHYKKLSLKYHPDTVKLAENQTVDDANEYFIKLTKAYKALTDEEIRRNYLEYGDPDGKQSMTVGLALPPWLIDAHNNIWVLAAYGVLFGGLLPYLVGQWWFGSRSKTKDGVHVKTASILFKDMVEDVTNQKILVALSKAAENDNKATSKVTNNEIFSSLETNVLDTWRKLGETYVNNIKSEADSSKLSRGSYVAYILFSAHLLRIAVPVSLKKLQTQLLIHVPTLLNSQVSMALGHNWYSSARSVMQISACFVQALHPSASPLLQFPSVTQADLQGIKDNDLPALLSKLNQSEAPRAKSIRTASKCWGKVDIVDARFKVIGERIITPGAFVNIVMKLRLVDPAKPAPVTTLSKDKEEADVKDADVKDEEELLLGKKEMGDLKPGQKVTQNAHAPRWPMARKPRWWCFLADVKNNKVFIYPVRIGDIPHATGSAEHDYRTFKVQFQAPQQVGTYTLRLVLVSDTFVGEEQGVYLQLQVDDLSALSADEQLQEDEISEPEEDSLAGQMAVMRGGKVKPSKYHQGSDDEDEESETDEDESDSESSDDD